MHYSNTTNGGAFYFEVEDNRLDAKFISYDAAAPTIPIVRDQFTIFKDVNKINTTAIIQNSPLTLTASWNGTYNWITNGNASTKSITVPTATIGQFSYQVIDTNNCIGDVFNVTISPSSTVVTTKLYIEGYYDTATHAMKPVIANQGIGVNTTDVAAITLELRDATTNAFVNSSSSLLKTDGNAIATFTPAISGSYYLAIKHRNALQTWSATPQTIGVVPLTYDFTTGSNKAYGNNMKQIEPGVWAFFSGDLDGDGFVDIPDYSLWESDYNDGAVGDFSSDLDGDGFVDIPDYSIWEQNYNSGVTSNFPTN